jgi:hypothetical protein
MTPNLLSTYIPEVSFLKELSFEYNHEIYKVHVNVLVENEEKIYKLYFKNNIENSEKSLMRLCKKPDANGSSLWQCKANYFSYINEAIADVAGAAIDKVLQEEQISEGWVLPGAAMAP